MPGCYTCNHPPRSSLSKTRANPVLVLGASQYMQPSVAPQLASSISILSLQEDSPSFNDPSPITKIPNELLNEIFTHALPSNISEEWIGSYHTAMSLSTVCKAFHRIVQPLMYSTIHLGGHNLSRPCLTVKQLHRSMEANTTLRGMVTTFVIHAEHDIPTDPISDHDFAIAKDLMGWMVNVEKYETLDPSTWPMVSDAVRKWKRLRHLSFLGENWGMMIDLNRELITSVPSLRMLNLCGFCVTKPGWMVPETIWSPPAKLSQDDERTSAITHLSFHDFGESPEALAYLLSLPRALTNFTFGKIFYSHVSWQLEMFQALLEPHQDTLQRIEIGALSRMGFTPISFLNFPNLEVLHLSHWVYRETLEVAAASLLAPRLSTFIWDFRVLDLHIEAWEDFGVEQKEWLISLCKLGRERWSALKRVKILFALDEWKVPKTQEALQGVVSPLELMDEVREVVKGFDVHLVCDGRRKDELMKKT